MLSEEELQEKLWKCKLDTRRSYHVEAATIKVLLTLAPRQPAAGIQTYPTTFLFLFVLLIHLIETFPATPSSTPAKRLDTSLS